MTWKQAVLTISLILAITGGGRAFGGTWTVPYWDNTSGNPYTDGDSNVWAVYQLEPTSAPDPSNPANYIPMTWVASGQ